MSYRSRLLFFFSLFPFSLVEARELLGPGIIRRWVQMVGLGNVSVMGTFRPMGSREGRGSGEGRHALRKRAHIFGTAGTWEQLAALSWELAG
jgi:hypothetical protein